MDIIAHVLVGRPGKMGNFFEFLSHILKSSKITFPCKLLVHSVSLELVVMFLTQLKSEPSHRLSN